MLRRIINFSVILMQLSFAQLFSQGDCCLDTLIYYDAENTISGFGTTDTDGMGIKFTPDSSWDKYDLLELHLLINNDVTNSGDSIFTGILDIHSNSDIDTPGSFIAQINFTAKIPNEIFPAWKVLHVQNPNLLNLDGSFWVLGNGLWGTMVSDTSSGHCYFHTSWIWDHWISSPFDFAVRAIVQKRDATLVNNIGKCIQSFIISQNYPNPFNPTTTIKYELPIPGHVSLKIFDLTGRLVKVLADVQQNAGDFSAQWDGTNLTGNSVAAGIYIYRVEFVNSAGERFVESRKMSLVK